MSWTCPACGSSIQHKEEANGLGVTYRCAVCRLELVEDAGGGTMRAAPLPPERPRQAQSQTVVAVQTEASVRRPTRSKKRAKSA
jgi:hypothetical protein